MTFVVFIVSQVDEKSDTSTSKSEADAAVKMKIKLGKEKKSAKRRKNVRKYGSDDDDN